MKPANPYVRLNDTGLLVPAFNDRYQLVLADLSLGGYQPLVRETRRSRERAKMLVKEGRSKSRGGLSMHCYDIAADTICAKHGWGCERFGCGFFVAYGNTVQARGLVWGGDWDSNQKTRHTSIDAPHCQAVPIILQDKIRSMKSEEIPGLIAEYLALKAGA